MSWKYGDLDTVINPKQIYELKVTSLKLNEALPNYFPNLRSLKLLNHEDVYLIYSVLPQLKFLKSLSIYFKF